MDPLKLREQLSSDLGIDVAVVYPNRWSAIEADPSEDNVGLLLQDLRSDRGVSEDVEGMVRAEFGKLIQPVVTASSNQHQVRERFKAQLREHAKFGDGVTSAEEVDLKLIAAAESGKIYETSLLQIYELIGRAFEGQELDPKIRKFLANNFNKAGLKIAFGDLSSDVTISLATQKKVSQISLPESVLEALQNYDPLKILMDAFNELPLVSVARRHDDEFGTDIHFVVSSGTQVTNEGLRDVPDDANAIVLWFHGSGTSAAYGGNFWQEMNALSAHGIASIGFDYPFHRNGPRDQSLADPKRFTAWLEKIVARYRERYPDKKIILAGHSFGPGAILEYLARYPNGADAAILLSPSGRFSKRMLDHYLNNVTGVLEGLDEEADGDFLNAVADLFAEQLSSQFTFIKAKAPMIPILTVVGENDQWFPDMDEIRRLASHFPTMVTKIVKRLDHFVFSPIVEDMDEAVARGVFHELPKGGRTRFVTWVVADYLHSLYGDAIPLEADKKKTQLSSVQKANLLYEQNGMFRIVAPDRAHLSNSQGADEALAMWEEAKRKTLDILFLKIPDISPKFYKEHQAQIDRVMSAMRSGKKLKGELHSDRSRILQKLRKYLSQQSKDVQRAQRSGHGTVQRSTDGQVGKNYWTRGLQQYVQEALIAHRTGVVSMPEDIAAQMHPLDRWAETVSGGVQKAADAINKGVRRLFGMSEPVSRYERFEERLGKRETLLRGIRDKINIRANVVLSLGNGVDVMKPFRLFDGTTRVTMLSSHGFGSPDQFKSFFTAKGLGYAQSQSVAGVDLSIYDYSFSAKSETIGGELINRLIAGLGSVRITALHYFVLDEAGNKKYVNPEPNAPGDQFANAELKFIDKDGTEKTVEVVQSDFLNPSSSVKNYLSAQPLNVVLAGHEATHFETEPENLSFYYQLLESKGISFVTGDRMPAIYRGTSPSRRPAVYLNWDQVERHDLKQLNDDANMLFEYGDRIYVASHRDFISSWKYGSTRGWEVDNLIALRASSRRGRHVEGPYRRPRGDKILSFSIPRSSNPTGGGGGNQTQTEVETRASVSADWSLVDQEKLRGSATLSDPLLGVNEAAAKRRRHEQASRANVRKTSRTNAVLTPAARPIPTMFLGR